MPGQTHDIPAVSGPADLTVEWLSTALGTAVTGVRTTAVGTGQTGATYRLHLESEDGALPATLIAKTGAEDRAVRERVATSYRAEVAFYRDIASTLTVPVPHCWASAISTDGADVVLLLDDLAPAEQGDQIAGCTPEVVLAGARALAGLHGPRWCDPTWHDLEVLTMPVATPESARGMGEIVRTATDVFLDTLGGGLSDEDRRTLDAVPAAVPAWLLARPERWSLLHGDFRLDNLLLGPDGGVHVVDWQTLSVGLPGRDLAYFVSTSLSVEDRRRSEAAAVAAYHQALAVPEHSLAECEEDYRAGLLQVPVIATLGWAFTTQTERGGRMMQAMVQRACAAIRDHGVLS